MNGTSQGSRRAYSHWLRTGYWPTVSAPGGLELKFNPYHDPRNGRFTFAPGSVGYAGSSKYARSVPARQIYSTVKRSDAAKTVIAIDGAESFSPIANQARPPSSPPPMRGRRSNAEAFHDPMTLQQALPGLRSAPGGAILAVADNIFSIFGPANEAQAALLDNWSRAVANEIRAIDPTGRHDPGSTLTIEGKINELAELRFRRAAAYLKFRGDVGPLQVETLRFVQQRTNVAYDEALTLLEAGGLKPRLSDREALGNYIDKQVRRELRQRLSRFGIEWAGKGPVRINKREYDTSGTDPTYRLPDARIGNVAFDVTLSQKTSATAQIQGFFAAEFRPDLVVIIRPAQLGGGHTYIISRQEAKR